uniref:Uncharacterized protein n=1 Tax=Oryctolagus cuniculus TaxID=9986 RepID=A0A5F9C388_RABIT
MHFRDLTRPTGFQVLNDYLVARAAPRGMCQPKQMWQCSKLTLGQGLLTCVMPYVGIITSSLRRRRRPASQEGEKLWASKALQMWKWSHGQ